MSVLLGQMLRQPRGSTRTDLQLDRLGLAELVDSVAAQFAAEPALADAAEGQLRVTVHPPVHPDGPGVDLTSSTQRGVDVGRPDTGGQPERGRVGNSDGL